MADNQTDNLDPTTPDTGDQLAATSTDTAASPLPTTQADGSTVVADANGDAVTTADGSTIAVEPVSGAPVVSTGDEDGTVVVADPTSGQPVLVDGAPIPVDPDNGVATVDDGSGTTVVANPNDPTQPATTADGSTIPTADSDADAPTTNTAGQASDSPVAGTPDAGTPDAGTPDAGTPDAGTPDAGTPVADASDDQSSEQGSEQGSDQSSEQGSEQGSEPAASADPDQIGGTAATGSQAAQPLDPIGAPQNSQPGATQPPQMAGASGTGVLDGGAADPIGATGNAPSDVQAGDVSTDPSVPVNTAPPLGSGAVPVTQPVQPVQPGMGTTAVDGSGMATDPNAPVTAPIDPSVSGGGGTTVPTNAGGGQNGAPTASDNVPTSADAGSEASAPVAQDPDSAAAAPEGSADEGGKSEGGSGDASKGDSEGSEAPADGGEPKQPDNDPYSGLKDILQSVQGDLTRDLEQGVDNIAKVLQDAFAQIEKDVIAELEKAEGEAIDAAQAATDKSLADSTFLGPLAGAVQAAADKFFGEAKIAVQGITQALPDEGMAYFKASAATAAEGLKHLGEADLSNMSSAEKDYVAKIKSALSNLVGHGLAFFHPKG